jgi:hypothetical protein
VVGSLFSRNVFLCGAQRALSDLTCSTTKNLSSSWPYIYTFSSYCYLSFTACGFSKLFRQTVESFDSNSRTGSTAPVVVRASIPILALFVVLKEWSPFATRASFAAVNVYLTTLLDGL